MGQLMLKEKSDFNEYMVRSLNKQDVKAAQQFLLHNLKELYNIDGDYPNSRDIWQMEEVYLKSPDHTIIGAFDFKGDLVGTIAVRPYDDRMAEVKGRYAQKKTAEMVRCYIDKSLRRKGIGTLLVREIFKACAAFKYEMIYLHTHKFLPGGFNFWQKQGFTITVDTNDKDETVHMEKVMNY